MSSEKETVLEVLQACNRRSFVRRTSLAGLAGAVVPAAASLFAPEHAQAAMVTPSLETDLAILNFALNLEYLEAEFYLYATTGTGIVGNGGTTASGDGTTPGGTVTIKANPKVTFSNAVVSGYAAEIAEDEFNHVKYLQGALGTNAVAAPNIDLENSFNALGQMALGAPFDPFVDDTSFLLGAFIFEDVGVTAYHGGAPLIYTNAYLKAAAAIMTVEALHAGEVRTLLYNASQASADPSVIINMVKGISDLRDMVDASNSANKKDQGIYTNGASNIFPLDANGLAFARTTNQVLRIVYGMGTAVGGSPTPGTFFPNGMNGVIK